MKDFSWMRRSLRAAALSVLFCMSVAQGSSQQVDSVALLAKVDAAVKARLDGISGYSAIEDYKVFRGKDETNPVAQMRVKTTYEQATGKTYQILSESGSSVIRNLVLHAILENETHVNKPGVREGAWLTTKNYEMKVQGGGVQKVDGRDCYALQLFPHEREPYLIVGTMWVDAKNGQIVRIEGKGAKSSNIFAGETKMKRDYADMGGFAQATRARAESDSFLFGLTVITIDYRDYQFNFK
jgi:hypothetical protein